MGGLMGVRMETVTVAPSYVTHYYRVGQHPFRNLSDLPEDELARVLAGLSSPEHQAASARRFGPRYMALRIATEARLRELFVAAGGRPQRRAPHYFVLGESAWFAGLYQDTAQVRLPLAALPDDATSLTYADSSPPWASDRRWDCQHHTPSTQPASTASTS